MSEQLGVCDDVSRGKMPHVQDIGCVNWRGMMTAEQFYEEWIKKPDAAAGNRRSFFRFAEAYAAAQLAEKEREILNLKSDAFEADLELTAAEQRLQEAQAELDALRAGARTGLLKYCMAGDVGQFADRMRNLLQAEDWNGLKNCVTDFFNYAKDRTESIFPMHEAELAEVNSRLRQREAELEQRWIAVEERLPDEPQHDVLLWTADDWEGGKNFQQIGIIGEFNRDEWDGKVTHWQPLPSPQIEIDNRVSRCSVHGRCERFGERVRPTSGE